MKPRLFETHFEIKAIDFWEYRSFEYLNLKEVKLINPMDKWWYRLYVYSSWEGLIFSDTDKIKLKIIKKNNGNWEYLSSNIENEEFNNIILEINN